jgi:hypothetical protein
MQVSAGGNIRIFTRRRTHDGGELGYVLSEIPPYQSAPAVVVAFKNAPLLVAFGLSGLVFAADADAITVYSAPSDQLKAIEVGRASSALLHPQGLAVDARGNLFVLTAPLLGQASVRKTSQIFELAPPYTSTAWETTQFQNPKNVDFGSFSVFDP